MKVKILNKAISEKDKRRIKRRLRIRGKISGTAEYPRVSFFRSNKNIYAQAIDDKTGVTLVSVSTYEKKFKDLNPTVESAKKLGVDMAARLKEKNISRVVFDRNGYKFHGVLKAFVEAISETGIKI